MDKLQALHSFWSGFSIPAYDETTVPDEKERIKQYGSAFPYITYEVATSDFNNDVALSASLWYRSESWSAITAKCNEIGTEISRGGKLVQFDGGAFWIRKSPIWAQRLSEPNDDMVRRILLNINIEFLD